MKFHQAPNLKGSSESIMLAAAAAAAAATATTATTTTHANEISSSDNEADEFGQTTNSDQLERTNAFLMDKNKKLFPQKLWELIHNPTIQHCLRWSDDGQRVYLSRNEFEAYYLKTPNNQFHTQKAISFVRQMNMYGFRKVDDCYYENDNFKRDQQHLLRNMIRRHPNKSLFVGLDHQLAAAAAAQQALHVNQHLHQLEQHHKHRAEQALRLSNYLNGNHSFHHQAALNHTHRSTSTHSQSPFEHMSSQLAARMVAANHLSQQRHINRLTNELTHKQQNHLAVNQTGNTDSINATSVLPTSASHQNSQSLHQPKKSRLLGDFYASLTSGNNIDNFNTSIENMSSSVAPSDGQLMHNQDSINDNSSVDSQCSSAINSGSAGSPQPTALSPNHQGHNLASVFQSRIQPSGFSPSAAAIRASLLASAQYHKQNSAIQDVVNSLVASNAASSNATGAAERQALQENLVRSLLQFKQQQHPQDLLAGLQHHQNQKTLLESLASLSSAGTGSIVDPSSESPPTERTISPSSPSTSHDEDNIALDLAKSSNVSKASKGAQLDYQDNVGEYPDVEIQSRAEKDEHDEDEADSQMADGVSPIECPLDYAKKVKRFLDDYGLDGIRRGSLDGTEIIQRKRLKLDSGFELTGELNAENGRSLSKSLAMELCERRGDKLDVTGLQEAARYVEYFLDTLFEGAASIARQNLKGDTSDECKSEQGNSNVIDRACLRSALEQIPSKLVMLIEQQVGECPDQSRES